MANKFTKDPNRPDCDQCGRPMANRGVSESGKKRYMCTTCKTSTTNTKHANALKKLGFNPDAAIEFLDKTHSKIADGCNVIVVTAAQNNTDPHDKGLAALKQYVKARRGLLVIIPIHYKNISLYTGGQQYLKWWHRDVKPYLVHDIVQFNNVDIRGDVKINATAFNPLGGKEPISGERWAVFGHPQFAMRTVPSISESKRIYTCGAITKKNYSKTNDGAKAEFHHVTGALVLERKDPTSPVWVRQLNIDSKGGFYDFDKYYHQTGITKNCHIEGLVTGDEHERIINSDVLNGTYMARRSLAKWLKPKYIVRNDVYDHYSGSHHHEKNPILQYRKFHLGQNNVRAELDAVVDHINRTTPKGATNIIVASNHHDHLYYWLNRVDPNKDPVNADLIYELRALQLKHATEGNRYDRHDTDPFRLYVEPKLTCKAVFLRRSDVFFIKTIDVSNHGDLGVNGARGSIRGLAKAAVKMIIGHSHGSGIHLSVYQVGKSSNPADYEEGLGSHTLTHALIYPNGKRTLVDFLEGDFKA